MNEVQQSINYELTGYLVYLPIVLLLTFFVGKALFTHGKFFMLEIFKENENIALSTNKLFKLGFYLLNIGFALLILRLRFVDSTTELVERLSSKIGGFSIYLGLTLFFNLILFMRGRSKSNEKRRNYAETSHLVE